MVTYYNCCLDQFEAAGSVYMADGNVGKEQQRLRKIKRSGSKKAKNVKYAVRFEPIL